MGVIGVLVLLFFWSILVGGVAYQFGWVRGYEHSMNDRWEMISKRIINGKDGRGWS